MSTPTRITHLVDGTSWEGTAERTSPVSTRPPASRPGSSTSRPRTSSVRSSRTRRRPGRTGPRRPSAKRSKVLFAFRQLLDERKQEIAALITAEHGKVLDDAVGEVTRGLEVAEFACGIPHLLKGGFSENASTSVDVYSMRQPLGVVAVISPFNFPAMVPMWFIPIAIACGNAVVLKPSEKDPSAALAVARLWKEAERRPARPTVFLAGLEDDRVPARDGDGDEPHRHHGGEIKGRDDRDDAEPLPHRVRVDAGRRVLGEPALKQVRDPQAISATSRPR